MQDLPKNSSGEVITHYMGKRGYILKKEFYDEDTLKSLREQLTVTPNVNTDYGAPAAPFPVYRESPNCFFMPKFFAIKHFGVPQTNFLPEGLNISLTLAPSFETRPNQLAPLEASWKALQTVGGGILSLGTGYGKTNIAINLIQRYGKKAIIIVHKEFLMNQWIERINTFLPGARVGKIQASEVDVVDKDIVIGMVQSISSKTYPMDTFDSFGIAVIDECHRIPCHHFSKALPKINCRKMLGLSATPKRDDGLTKVLQWYIGDIIYEAVNQEIKNVEVKRYTIHSDDENYKKEILNHKFAPMLPKMINNITEYTLRTRLILNLIKELRATPGRQILLLSDRRAHLEELYAEVIKEKICTVGYYVGGMKQAALKASESMDLLLGTFCMAAEGMDIPTLNTLILASPKSKITQAVGRIIRKKHADVAPLVVDLIDYFSLFISQGNRRLVFYKKTGYPIHNYIVKLNGTKDIEITYKDMIDASGKTPKKPRAPRKIMTAGLESDTSIDEIDGSNDTSIDEIDGSTEGSTDESTEELIEESTEESKEKEQMEAIFKEMKEEKSAPIKVNKTMNKTVNKTVNKKNNKKELPKFLFSK